MCGIAGIVLRHREASVDLDLLARMTERLRHRGPDDGAVEVHGNVGLGARRLAVIDIEGGHQPMSTADGSLWIVFNGELYNYLELRSELLQRGYVLRTHSDTEVVLNLYDWLGTGMFEWMNGMFAFAIHDRRQGRVLLARDRFGEKPLYFTETPSGLLFASEIKALLESPELRREPDPVALQEYLTFQYCLDDRTLFKGVRKLRPASYLLLDDCGRTLDAREYWSLRFEEDHTRDARYWADELRFVLEDSVRIRLRSDVPVGTYVSGGLDSSTIACTAAKLSGRGLPAFTGWFAESDAYSEVPYAEAVTRHTGSDHHLVCPTAEDFEQRFARIIWAMDEPAAGPGVFAQLMVSELAREHVTVVLGGQGGDELFGGYARYLLMYLEESIKGSIYGTQDPRRHIVTLDRVLPNLALLRDYTPLLQRFWSHGLFGPVEQRYYSLIARSDGLAACLSPELLARRDEAALYETFELQFNDILRHTPGGGSALFNRMTAYDTRTLLQSLLHVEDRMSMAVSLESRLPLLDHRIPELMFGMPPAFKYHEGTPKAILLDAARTLLPDAIVQRKDKKGFPVPFVEWTKGPLRGYVRDVLLGERATARGLYRREGIERLIDGELPYGRELWGLLSLEVWFQTFMDG